MDASNLAEDCSKLPVNEHTTTLQIALTSRDWLIDEYLPGK
jgi:hypothetical protein